MKTIIINNEIILLSANCSWNICISNDKNKIKFINATNNNSFYVEMPSLDTANKVINILSDSLFNGFDRIKIIVNSEIVVTKQ